MLKKISCMLMAAVCCAAVMPVTALADTAEPAKPAIIVSEDQPEPEIEYESVKVNFLPNGGTGRMESMGLDYGQEATLNKNEFKRSGYKFTGWNTEPNGKGISYNDGQKITAEENLDLYAQWKKKENYKLTVKNVKIKRGAKKLVLRATLKINNRIAKSKMVAFTFKGKTYKVKTNSKGIAKAKVKKSVRKKLKSGKKYKVKVKYTGNDYTVTRYGKVTVKK